MPAPTFPTAPPAPHAHAGEAKPYRRQAGQEPLPGYHLLEPLGRGGFGEVWKCEAPGGLHKAIKFVSEDAEGGMASLQQEAEAFQHIKAIRHPFLLTLERVELAPGELIMVMELADQQLQDRYASYAAQGYPGIPRDELLGYLADASEMLDHIGGKHGLQHLDIKPANLFLVCGRVKVGDFGLVRRHERSVSTPGQNRGLTPRYVAPEVLHGRVDPRSDQYCLALVYQELLTGVFPYSAKSAQQMMLQHASAQPNLAPLPAEDRAAVARALSKAPTDRFESCLDFIRALVAGPFDTVEEAAHDTWPPANPARKTQLDLRQARLNRPQVNPELPAAPVSSAGLDPSQLTGRMTRPPQPSGQLRLMTPTQRKLYVPAAPDSEILELISAAPEPSHRPVVLPRIWSVLPVERLTVPSQAEVIAPDGAAMVEAIVMSLCADGRLPASGAAPQRQLDGTWTCRFPVRPITGTAAIRLQTLTDGGTTTLDAIAPDVFALRREASPSGIWSRFSAKKAGLQVTVQLPKGGGQYGEAVLTGQVYGQPDAAMMAAAERHLPEFLDDVRGALANAEDRRKAVRLATDLPVQIVPVGGDGTLGQPFAGRCVDISLGGLRCTATQPIETAYAYTTFTSLTPVAGWAILTRLTRANATPTSYTLAGRFRVDL